MTKYDDLFGSSKAALKTLESAINITLGCQQSVRRGHFRDCRGCWLKWYCGEEKSVSALEYLEGKANMSAVDASSRESEHVGCTGKQTTRDTRAVDTPCQPKVLQSSTLASDFVRYILKTQTAASTSPRHQSSRRTADRGPRSPETDRNPSSEPPFVDLDSTRGHVQALGNCTHASKGEGREMYAIGLWTLGMMCFGGAIGWWFAGRRRR